MLVIPIATGFVTAIHDHPLYNEPRFLDKVLSISTRLMTSSKEQKEVRFLLPLSPPPEETMSRSSGRIKARVVLPTAYKEEEVKLGSAVTWGETELRLLGVHFLKKQTIDLNARVFKVTESDWPPELRERMSFVSCVTDCRGERGGRAAWFDRGERLRQRYHHGEGCHAGSAILCSYDQLDIKCYATSRQQIGG
jgi:hypothetical protein